MKNMKKIKGTVKAILITDPKEGDLFVWYKDGKWCFGKIIEEGSEGKTRVLVDGFPYETHTNTLNTLVFFNEKDKPVCEIYNKDWEAIVDLGVINTDENIELNVGKIHNCSYHGSCECEGDMIDGCDLSYTRPTVYLTEMKDVYPKM
jgi:hypothetical protein